MDNSVGTDYGSEGGLNGGGLRGRKWDNSNGIKVKFKKKEIMMKSSLIWQRK